MVSAVPTAEPVAAPPRSAASLLASVLFLILILAWAAVTGERTGAVYLVSYWHYYLYFLAYYLGAQDLHVFKRDAILLKSVSLAALGCAYLTLPLDAVSLVVVGLGFGLNLAGARALGADRTYYGYELADLPPQRITAFPYSWISHPMLLGNIAAFGGTLLNADFRARWWPLALGHVALNLGLLLMELALVPQRRWARRSAADVGKSAGTALASPMLGLGLLVSAGVTELALASLGGPSWLASATLAVGTAAYAQVLSSCYSTTDRPRPGPGLFPSRENA